LSSKIKIFTYSFSLIFVENFSTNQTNGSNNNWGQSKDGQTDVQTEQTTDRQRYFFELTPIHKGDLIFFVCLGEREQIGQNLYLLVRYASLLCSLALLAGG
jgi:hypothetical protein